jgi:hypothetical protein
MGKKTETPLLWKLPNAISVLYLLFVAVGSYNPQNLKSLILTSSLSRSKKSEDGVLVLARSHLQPSLLES